ncbi:MAG: vitamin K epoxide reductase family protein [Pseudomonadota bacterium]
MRRWALAAAAAAALLGIAVSAVSISQHMRIDRKGLEEASFCAISSKINCDIVNASSYSEALGVPVAAWGFTFYLLVGGMALFSFFSKGDRRATVAMAWFMSLAAFLYSAYLAYIAWTVLGVVCLECVAMYIVNIAFVIFLFAALKVPLGGIMRFVRDYFKAALGRASGLDFKPLILKHAVVIAVVFLAGFGAMRGLQAKGDKAPDSADVDEKVRAYYMESLYAIEPDPSWAIWGNPEAKVTVVEFSEFQCPFCRVAAFNLKPRLQEFKKDVRFYFVNYPLDQSCNKELDHPMHQWACMAAKAGICAKMRGDFWDFHDDIFRNQRKLSDKLISELVEKRGWNPDEFKSCMDSPEVEEQIQKDLAAGRKSYVSGTPTVILDNRKLKYWSDPKFLQSVVKEEIKRSKKN